jgi:hypothetical protein
MIDLRADLLRLINGFQASQAIHVAATLGIADRLHRSPASATELADAIGADPDALRRLIRALISIGVMKQVESGRVVLTGMGEYLRRDVEGTCSPMAELIGRPNFWGAWGELLHAVQTGDTAFVHLHDCNVWDYRSQHPDEARIFDRAMASGTQQFAKAVLEVCDFGSFKHVVDVGGGDGMFLTKILEIHPTLHGTLFDQPHVIARAGASQSSQALNGRYRAVGGNFFQSVPDGGDAYLLKWILHDWDDAASINILKSCARAMKAHARLIVAEYVIGPETNSPDGPFMDLMMMVMAGGRERTRDEFGSIFASAGFRLASITPTVTRLCVIEGVLDQK